MYLFLIIGLLGTAGCDTFLQRYPENELNPHNFWKSERDLKLYANGFYSLIKGQGGGARMLLLDNQSDNLAPISYNVVAAGQYTVPTTGGGWSWGYLRRVNYFLAHYQKADLPAEVKSIYAGEARFFRAWFYFRKVKRFGAVPWISKPLQTDSDALHAPRTPRKQVMDSVLADINFAIAHLPPMEQAEAGRIHRAAALALKARITLFGGTFRKYHGLGDWQPMLKEAVEASKRLIENGKFEIYSTGIHTRIIITCSCRKATRTIRRSSWPRNTLMMCWGTIPPGRSVT